MKRAKTVTVSVTKKNEHENETPAQRAKRLGPSVEIVRFVNGRESDPIRFGIGKCKHVRSVSTTRKTFRCRRCRDKKPADVSSMKITRFVKRTAAEKKAA